MSHQGENRNGGFVSGPELGAVFALLLMAGLLVLPAAQGGARQSLIARDVMNQRLILSASLLYTEEWNGAFPDSLGWEKTGCSTWGGDGPSWFEVIRPYVGFDPAFVSPAERRVPGGPRYLLTSYAPNYLLMGWAHRNPGRLNPTWDRGRTVPTIDGVERPGEVVMLQLNFENPRSWPCYQSVEAPNNASWFSRRNDFFSGGANFGRVDGGVSWVPLPRTNLSARMHAGLTHYPFPVADPAPSHDSMLRLTYEGS